MYLSDVPLDNSVRSPVSQQPSVRVCLFFQIIFVTALFYLLSSSGEQYKPVEWFGKLSATGTAGFGDSAYGAIRFVWIRTY